MAGAFPSISGAYPVRFPYKHTLLIRSCCMSFWSGASQRYAISGLLNSFKWNYRRINYFDLQTVQAFFNAQKGAFDYTWSISLVDPATELIRSYANMAFDSDAFTYTENPAQWFSLGLDAVQTVSEAVSANPVSVQGFGPDALTSDTSNPPFVASVSSATVNPAWLSFNGDATNGWMTAGVPCWIELDTGAGSASVLGSYAIAGGYAGAGNGPQAWTMEGSNDGTTWVTLDSQTGQTTGWGFAGGGALLQTYTIASPGAAYRYFRLNVTANNGGSVTEIDALYLYSAASTLVGPSYPAINGGVLVQIPFGTAPSFKTFRNDLDSGKRISWAAWPVPLNKWALSYPAITDEEVQELVIFYLTQGGAVNQFSFTDPNTLAVHDSCYFGAQGIELTRISPNLNSLRCSIEEFSSIAGVTPQIITFPGIPNHLPTDAPFALAATASSGLAVSYSVTSGPATISGSTVTITGSGVVTIQASQAGAGTYAAATPVSVTFTVTTTPPPPATPTLAPFVTIRESTAQTPATAASITIPWPTGTIAGDLAVLFVAAGYGPSAVPTGWTSLYEQTTATNINGLVAWKTLTSGDITAGSVTVNLLGSSPAGAQIITLVRAPAVLECDGDQQVSVLTDSISTSGAVPAGALALYFGAGRADGLSPHVTVNRGTLLNSEADADFSTCMYSEVMPGGVITAIFDFSPSCSAFDAIVIIGSPLIIGPQSSSGTLMTTDTAPSPYVATASSEMPDSYPGDQPAAAFNAFSNMFSTDSTIAWISNNGLPAYLQIDLGSLQLVGGYTIQMPDPVGAEITPQAWQMQGSTDGASWITLDTQTGASGWVSGPAGARSFAVDNPAAILFRYYRLNITASNGSSTYVCVGSWFIFGF